MKNLYERSLKNIFFLVLICSNFIIGQPLDSKDSFTPSSMSAISSDDESSEKSFITVSTAVGSVVLSSSSFVPFSSIIASGEGTPGFTLGTTSGTIAIPESGMYVITYGITSTFSASTPTSILIPAYANDSGPLPLSVQPLFIPPWGTTSLQGLVSSVITELDADKELGIFLTSLNMASPSLTIDEEQSGVPSAYMTVTYLYSL